MSQLSWDWASHRMGRAANGLKLSWLLVGLPLGFAAYGPLGAVFVVAASDLFRYVPIFVGQVRERFSFGAQDFAATVVAFGLFGIWEWVRLISGFSTLFGTPLL